MTDSGASDDTPTDAHTWWCPACKAWRELQAATKPVDGGDAPGPANRCAECDSTLVVTLEERDYKLTQYGQVMSYLQYENSVHGARSNFFLIAITALLGFAAGGLLPLEGENSLAKSWLYFAVSIAGLHLTELWSQSTKAGNFWLDHWQKILRKLEPAAYGDMRLHRMELPEEGGPARTRIRTINEQARTLFFIIWLLSIGYAVSHLMTMYWNSQ